MPSQPAATSAAHSESGELRFARRLASNDKKKRDKAVRVLKKFLAEAKDLTEESMMRTWKALFYCMWHSDKRPVQQQLAETLASLVFDVPRPSALMFIECFYRTMAREWPGIDGLRLDKYYALLLEFLHASLKWLANGDWDTEEMDAFADIISGYVVTPSTRYTGGIGYHYAEHFLDALFSSTNPDIPFDVLNRLFVPFYAFLSFTSGKLPKNRISEAVFEPLLSGEVLSELLEGAGGSENSSDSEDDGSSEETNRSESTHGERNSDDGTEEDDLTDRLAAGHIERLYGVSESLLQLASSPETQDDRRGYIYKLQKRFYDAYCDMASKLGLETLPAGSFLEDEEDSAGSSQENSDDQVGEAQTRRASKEGSNADGDSSDDDDRSAEDEDGEDDDTSDDEQDGGDSDGSELDEHEEEEESGGEEDDEGEADGESEESPVESAPATKRGQKRHSAAHLSEASEKASRRKTSSDKDAEESAAAPTRRGSAAHHGSKSGGGRSKSSVHPASSPAATKSHGKGQLETPLSILRSPATPKKGSNVRWSLDRISFGEIPMYKAAREARRNDEMAAMFRMEAADDDDDSE